MRNILLDVNTHNIIKIEEPHIRVGGRLGQRYGKGSLTDAVG